MKLVRYTHPQLTTTADFEQILNELWGNFPRWAVAQEGHRARQAPVDLYEDDNNVYARLELPGFKKDEIQIHLESGVLSVEVDRKTDGKNTSDSVKLARAVSVPEGIQVENVKAQFEDGILTVTLPKQEARKPRTIEIQ